VQEPAGSWFLATGFWLLLLCNEQLVTSNYMPNSYFRFKHFIIHQDRCAMKVTTDACLFGAWAAEEIKNEKLKIKNALDIGSGTGVLSLMFTQKNPSSFIDAIEIDDKTYEQAKENIIASSFAEKINIICGDAKTFSFSKKYDVIISNPPFYESEIISADEKKNISRHHAGLLIEELIKIIKENLSIDGVFYLLLPFKRNEEIKRVLFKQNLFVSKIVFVRQSTKHNYFRLMIKGNLNNKHDEETSIEEISIWDYQQQYTNEFTELLKDYYLDL
jgi:tRNA1Val (adenine37-N6)-methyltransferase